MGKWLPVEFSSFPFVKKFSWQNPLDAKVTHMNIAFYSQKKEMEYSSKWTMVHC